MTVNSSEFPGYTTLPEPELLFHNGRTGRHPLVGLIEQLAELSNLDAGAVCDWDMFELTAANAHAGQTLELVFESAADAASITSMGFDTMTLEAMSCP